MEQAQGLVQLLFAAVCVLLQRRNRIRVVPANQRMGVCILCCSPTHMATPLPRCDVPDTLLDLERLQVASTQVRHHLGQRLGL